MDVFGGPVETPEHARIADRGVRFVELPHDGAVLADALLAADGRNATATAWRRITEFADGFPGFSARIPFENGTSPRSSTSRGEHVLRREVAPHARRGVRHAACKGRWPLGRGFERFYGFLGGETNQWYPDLV